MAMTGLQPQASHGMDESPKQEKYQNGPRLPRERRLHQSLAGAGLVDLATASESSMPSISWPPLEVRPPRREDSQTAPNHENSTEGLRQVSDLLGMGSRVSEEYSSPGGLVLAARGRRLLSRAIANSVPTLT